ncbi:carbamoyltransferase HypF [Streptomyces brevispora]|uniref:Carbamoyltransferase n=1 Tax=Streptomyces brevispora TaxID=887462 RepID=A0A561V3H6_9ACTN|nr:carbamoyltransferase HypF [Streptomyces brevispora]TWG06171.1 hydrogenase maturation protein HypF [Streptomyces brevispora]WSC12862.1 carbamoyltransferase HypF [Streptomyces brevispora]
MCLGIPGRVVEIVDGYAGQLALVDVEGARRRVNIGMLDEAPGCDDWVLLHMGFAVELIDRAKAREALSGLEMMGRGRAERVRRRFEVRGVVQGVGFRPFVYVTASELMLTGTVTNTGDGVLAEVEGTSDAVDEFGRRLRTDAPPLAVVEDVRTSEQPTRGGTGFTIEESSGGGRGRTLVSPDIATCRDCLDELADAANRRYRHPFITCTHCGPRFTIVTGLPYDRAATTMAEFEMCGACRAEYEDPRDRRFHAQPIACPDCGPRLELVDGDGVSRSRDEDALRDARELLADGGIIAVKGLGGYHLVCDARDDAAVAELRRRKRRGGKPFAVMVPGLDVARELVTVTAEEEELLTGGRRPIVLLPRRAAGTGVSDAVAPGSRDLGLLLPYTPLHVLLFGIGADRPGPDALVMTSANLSGEPIVTDDEVALTSLAPLVDAWLRHDRRIHVPCDDSVSRWVAGAELPLRRSRGYAPLPIALPFHVTPTLAVGADLKNACALGEGRYAWLSQHIGDMDDLSTVDALTRTEKHLEDLTGVAPARLVTDRHPGYHSTGWARAHAAGRPVRTAQHHHAHIASVMAEHGLGADESVIGVAFDGTGHGDDGAAWGGEVLVAGYASYRRAAHLGYVPLAGGDASVLRPYRMALAHLHAAGVPWDEDAPAVRACPPEERDVLAHQFTTGFGCVPTSSMGRLFDAVASLTGVRHVVAYEAEAAMELEGLARTAGTEGGYRFGIRPGTGREPAIADPGPVIRAVVSDVRAGIPAAQIAARFHTSVAALVTELADRCRASTGLDTVALGGGVFQNAVLLEATQLGLTDRGFTVLRPRLLPPNDGGIALGQLMIAAAG